MKKENKKLFFIILFALMFPVFSIAQVDIESRDTDINLIVEGCNNNSICELVIGENTENCPLDCPVTPTVDEDESSSRSGSRIIPPNDIFPNPTPIFIQYPSIQNVSIKVENKNVFILWSNPDVPNFDFVRIMKNDFYSTSPYEGVVIYEGLLEDFLDTVDEFDKDYYYNFFAKYDDGTFSSVVPIRVNSQNPFYIEREYVNPVNPLKQVFFSPKLNIFEFTFSQNDKQLVWKGKLLQAQAEIPIHVTLPKKNFFGPIYDVYIYADFYNIENNFLRQEIFKMDYRPGLERYEAEIKNITEGQKIFFSAVLVDDEKNQSEVSGIININDSLYVQDVVFDSCLGGTLGWQRVFMYLKCDLRWITLFLIVVIAYSLFRRKFILKKSQN
jgi:hypothetical protein